MDRERRSRTGGRARGVERQKPLERRCSSAQRPPAQNGDATREARSTKDAGKLFDAKLASHGKALSDKPALKPYWGNPAVRNFREGNGNVGIMRSPLRAIALPDQSSGIASADLAPRPNVLRYFFESALCSMQPFSSRHPECRPSGTSLPADKIR